MKFDQITLRKRGAGGKDYHGQHDGHGGLIIMAVSDERTSGLGVEKNYTTIIHIE